MLSCLWNITIPISSNKPINTSSLIDSNIEHAQLKKLETDWSSAIVYIASVTYNWHVFNISLSVKESGRNYIVTFSWLPNPFHKMVIISLMNSHLGDRIKTLEITTLPK